jgi:hypothetical protein
VVSTRVEQRQWKNRLSAPALKLPTTEQAESTEIIKGFFSVASVTSVVKSFGFPS